MSDDVEAHWLNAEEQAMWLQLSQVLVRLPSVLESQLQRDAGLGHFEYLVLAVLSMAPDRRLRLSEVARLSGSSLTRLSNLVTRFERRGWVRREPDPQDLRSTFGVLTDEGMRVVEHAAPHHVNEVRRLVVDPLTRGQRRVVAQAAGRILEAMDPGRPPPPWAPSAAGADDTTG